MKITKGQLKDTLIILKNYDKKDQSITLEVEDNILNMYARNDSSLIKLKSIKTEEKESPRVTIKKEFLTKLEKQNAEEFNLKLNQKTVTSKVNGINFQTNILTEELETNFNEEEPKDLIKLKLTPEIMKALNTAMNFADSGSKRPILQNIFFTIENKELKISATDSFKLYINKFEIDSEETLNIILRKETINLLNSIFEVTNKKGFPFFVNKEGLFIISKGIYSKNSLVLDNMPNIDRALELITKEKTKMVISLTQDGIEKLKSISTKSNTLDIEKKGKEIHFISKTDVEKNSFSIESDDSPDFTIHANYQQMILSMADIGTFEIKERALLFKNGNEFIMNLLLKNID